MQDWLYRWSAHFASDFFRQVNYGHLISSWPAAMMLQELAPVAHQAQEEFNAAAEGQAHSVQHLLCLR